MKGKRLVPSMECNIEAPETVRLLDLTDPDPYVTTDLRYCVE